MTDTTNMAKKLLWAVLISFAILIIVGVVAAYVFFFIEFKNAVVVAICSCIIICCAFICTTLLLIFALNYLYKSRKASTKSESINILEKLFNECYKDKEPSAKSTKTLEKSKDSGSEA